MRWKNTGIHEDFTTGNDNDEDNNGEVLRRFPLTILFVYTPHLLPFMALYGCLHPRARGETSPIDILSPPSLNFMFPIDGRHHSSPIFNFLKMGLLPIPPALPCIAWPWRGSVLFSSLRLPSSPLNDIDRRLFFRPSSLLPYPSLSFPIRGADGLLLLIVRQRKGRLGSSIVRGT
ncbi:hypothetical protein FRC18_008764 [Serendipita sp. 400]|nr:hypothetical protein FRC18_008764 [Serendipita sp. 400]